MRSMELPALVLPTSYPYGSRQYQVANTHKFAPRPRVPHTLPKPPAPNADRRHALRSRTPPTLRLAAPLVLAEIGWMSMGIVDTIMVGHLPNSATPWERSASAPSIFIVLGLFGGGTAPRPRHARVAKPLVLANARIAIARWSTGFI